MSLSANAANKPFTKLSLAVGLLLILLMPQRAYADTNVSVSVCNSERPVIMLESPQSDSVVNTPSVVLKGTAIRTNQIDVEVDGQYDSTIAFSPDDPTFNKQVSLNAGTHTITLTANHVCRLSPEQTQLIITYQPQGKPSRGETTPTTVGPASELTAERTLAEKLFDFLIENFWSVFAFNLFVFISLLIYLIAKKRRRDRNQRRY